MELTFLAEWCTSQPITGLNRCTKMFLAHVNCFFNVFLFFIYLSSCLTFIQQQSWIKAFSFNKI